MLLLNDYFFAAFWVDLDNPNLSVKAAKAATASRSSGRKRAATAKMQKLKTAQHAAGFSKGQRFTLRRAAKKKKPSSSSCVPHRVWYSILFHKWVRALCCCVVYELSSGAPSIPSLIDSSSLIILSSMSVVVSTLYIYMEFI